MPDLSEFSTLADQDVTDVEDDDDDDDEGGGPSEKVPQRGKDGKFDRLKERSKNKGFYEEKGAYTEAANKEEDEFKKRIQLHLVNSDIRLKNIEDKYQEMSIHFSEYTVNYLYPFQIHKLSYFHFYFKGAFKKLPDKLRNLSSLTGSGLGQLKASLDKYTDILQLVEKDGRALRHTQAVKSIKLSEWLPIDSDKGLRRLFRVSDINFCRRDIKILFSRHLTGLNGTSF